MSIYLLVDGDSAPKALSIDRLPAVGDVIKYWHVHYRVRERVFDVDASRVFLYATPT